MACGMTCCMVSDIVMITMKRTLLPLPNQNYPPWHALCPKAVLFQELGRGATPDVAWKAAADLQQAALDAALNVKTRKRKKPSEPSQEPSAPPSPSPAAAPPDAHANGTASLQARSQDQLLCIHQPQRLKDDVLLVMYLSWSNHHLGIVQDGSCLGPIPFVMYCPEVYSHIGPNDDGHMEPSSLIQ